MCGAQEQSLCIDCCNEKVELIRNSCIELDNVIEVNRLEINRVFNVSSGIQSSGEIEPTGDSSIASNNSIKVLTQQLLKLQIVNEKVKVIGIERTIDSIIKRNAQLSSRVQHMKLKIDLERALIEKARGKITGDFQTKSSQLESERHFQMLQISRVQRQAIRFQQRNFSILVEAIFGAPKRKRQSFFGQPVINIEGFFGHNNKLEQLNTFIENLIILQTRLVNVFEEELGMVPLPYINELQKLLPNLKFFGLVRDKEIQMVGNGDDDLIDETTPESVLETTPAVGVEDGKRVSQVINLGDALRLPLSSKTINNQRRQSLNTEEAVVEVSVDVGSESSDAKPAKVKLPTAAGTSSSGKRLIIIPHRIITKPFTKLSQKEFIKFLQTIVKILVNFKIIFAKTLPLTEVYNFSRILEHVSSMGDKYFNMKLEKLDKLKLLSIPNLPSLTPLDDLSLTISATNSGSIVSKPSIANFYSKFFPSDFKSNHISSNFSGGIFGNVSEMGELRTKDITHDSQHLELRPIDELKVTMQQVYQKMVGGSKERMVPSRVQLKDWDVISKMM